MYVKLVGVGHLAQVPRGKILLHVSTPTDIDTSPRNAKWEIGCVHILGFELDGGDDISLQREDSGVKQINLNLKNLGVGFPLTPKCLPFGQPQYDMEK